MLSRPPLAAGEGIGKEKENMGEDLYDVVAVDIQNKTVRLMAHEKTSKNAEAIILIAIARRGVEKEFYVVVPAGLYQGGDTYHGRD